jgi:hypothetical protein
MTLRDLFPPGSAANATIWVTEAAGHVFLGIVLTALAGAVLWVLRWLGWSAPGISEAEALKLWGIVEIGLGGYVIGRSAEKTLPRIVEVLKR